MSSGAAAEHGTHRIWSHVKTTLIGGVVFLLPLVVIIALVGRAARLLEKLSQPLAGYVPVKSVLGVLVMDLVTVVLLLVACFLAGLLARASFAHRFVKRAEAGVLWRIPGYGFVKGLTDSLDRSAATSSMKPVMIRFDDCTQLAFEVDRFPDGRRVVYVPSAPEPRAGTVMVMDADRVEPVPISFVAAVQSLRALGHGLVGQLQVAAANGLK